MRSGRGPWRPSPTRSFIFVSPWKVLMFRRWFFLTLILLTFSCLFYIMLISDGMVQYELNLPDDTLQLQQGKPADHPANEHSTPQPARPTSPPHPVSGSPDSNAQGVLHLDSIVVLRNASRIIANDTVERQQLTIPKIIHQTWDDSKVPGQVAKWMVSWQKQNPDFKYHFWTDVGARRLIEDDFLDKYTHLYDDYPYKINRADLRRLFILYKHGGVFADLDVECLRPLSDLLSRYQCILSQEPEEHQALFYDYKHHNYALTGFMACRPHHPFFKYLLHMLPKYAKNARTNHWNDNILNSTGPMFVSEVVKNYVETYNNSENGLLHIAPSHWFMPTFDPVHNDEFYMKCTKPEVPLSPRQEQICDRLKERKYKNIPHDDAYANHHWLHSWGHMFIPQGYLDVQDVLQDYVMIDR